MKLFNMFFILMVLTVYAPDSFCNDEPKDALDIMNSTPEMQNFLQKSNALISQEASEASALIQEAHTNIGTRAEVLAKRRSEMKTFLADQNFQQIAQKNLLLTPLGLLRSSLKKDAQNLNYKNRYTAMTDEEILSIPGIFELIQLQAKIKSEAPSQKVLSAEMELLQKSVGGIVEGSKLTKEQTYRWTYTLELFKMRSRSALEKIGSKKLSVDSFDESEVECLGVLQKLDSEVVDNLLLTDREWVTNFKSAKLSSKAYNRIGRTVLEKLDLLRGRSDTGLVPSKSLKVLGLPQKLQTTTLVPMSGHSSAR